MPKLVKPYFAVEAASILIRSSVFTATVSRARVVLGLSAAIGSV
jgi:hypothetical protein